MSRPFVYKLIDHSQTDAEMTLCSAEKLYGLVHNGEWLIQSRPTMWKTRRIKKYYRHIYSTPRQADHALRKIFERYGIRAEIKEIKVNDLAND